MITKLTKEQEGKMAEYRDKWLKIGLSTKQFSRQEAEGIMQDVYKYILQKNYPDVLIIMDSPLSAWGAVCLRPQVGSRVESRVRSQVKSQVESQVWTQVRARVKSSQAELQAWTQVRLEVGAQVESQMASQVSARVELEAGAQVIWPYLDGNFWSPYLSFYDFMSYIMNVNFGSQYHIFKKTTRLSLIYPFDDCCILSQLPVEIHMKDKVLHNDGAPSIKYKDGFSVWSLNGVRVTKEIAETPFNQLDAKLLIRERNVDVRREIARKISIEKVCKDLNAQVIDTVGNYELLLLDIGDFRLRPYLKMKNPSIGVYHIEGVHPDCNTVEKALNWRNGSKDKPVILT